MRPVNHHARPIPSILELSPSFRPDRSLMASTEFPARAVNNVLGNRRRFYRTFRRSTSVSVNVRSGSVADIATQPLPCQTDHLLDRVAGAS
jgi:hypothetical protein